MCIRDRPFSILPNKTTLVSSTNMEDILSEVSKDLSERIILRENGPNRSQDNKNSSPPLSIARNFKHTQNYSLTKTLSISNATARLNMEARRVRTTIPTQTNRPNAVYSDKNVD